MATPIARSGARFGTIKYNRHMVRPLRPGKIIRLEPVYDPTGRSVKFVRLGLYVCGTIQNDTIAGSAALHDTIWAALAKPRQRLEIKDIGLPNIDTNTLPDLNLGPRTKVIS